MVEIPGAVLEVWSLADQLSLVASIYGHLGMRGRRVDVAVDFFAAPGQVQGLLPAIIAAHQERGEMVRPKIGKPVVATTGGGLVTEEGIYLGSRSSDAFVYAYDKGLERGEGLRRGAWVRWEGRFSGERANEVLLTALSLADHDDRLDFLRGASLGIVDFRADGDRRGPVPDWWREFTCGESLIHIKAPRPRRSLEKFRRHARQAVGMKVAKMAHASGMPVEDVLAIVFEGLQPEASDRRDPVVSEFLLANGIAE
jgi:hypothetical protein